MAEYKLCALGESVIRISDGAAIPSDPLNQDRVAYQAWLDGGGVPDAAEPLPVATTIDGPTFLARVSDAEIAAITSSSNAQVRRWVELLRLRGDVEVDGATAIAAKGGLVALGLLSAARAEEIFSPPT